MCAFADFSEYFALWEPSVLGRPKEIWDAELRFGKNVMSIKINWIGMRRRMRERAEGWRRTGWCVCVFVCEASRSASSDLPPLFKCWKRQFAWSPPAFSSLCSVWSNLPFQPHFYLIASSETKWHRGHTLGLECRCNANTVHPQIENEETKEEGTRQKTFVTLSTHSWSTFCFWGSNASLCPGGTLQIIRFLTILFVLFKISYGRSQYVFFVTLHLSSGSLKQSEIRSWCLWVVCNVWPGAFLWKLSMFLLCLIN